MGLNTQKCNIRACGGSETYIFPTQGGVTVFTVDVGHCVKSCKQKSLLGRTTADVDSKKQNAGS